MDLFESDRKRLLRSALMGTVFWLVMLLGLTFMPVFTAPKPKEVFMSVKLTLNQSTVSEAAPKASAPVVKNVPEKTKTVQKAATPAKKAASPKTSSQAKAAPASTGLGIPNFSSPVTSSNVKTGDAEYLDFSSSNETQRPTTTGTTSAGKSVAEFEGKAAVVQKNSDSGALVSGKKSTAKSSGSAASEATSSSLAKIAGQQQTGTPDEGSVAGAASGGTSSGRISTVSGLSFEGAPRKLLSPAEPAITLPADLARLVDADRKITVHFTVRPDGTVPYGLISFSDSALMPAKILDYLRIEFSRWRFEKSTQDGQAAFQYSIKVK